MISLLSNQILQDTIDGLKKITRRDFSILEREGMVAVSTESITNNEVIGDVAEFVRSAAETQLVLGHHYFKVLYNGVAEYVVMVKGEDDETYRIGKIAAFQIQGLLTAYKERFDKDNFIKNLLLDNLLLVDIYSRAKKLQIDSNVRRVVFLIETKMDEETPNMEIIKNIFPIKQRDIVTRVDEDHIILVKELRERDNGDTLIKHAKVICDTLPVESLTNVKVGIGSIVNDLKNISRSYKEAKMSLEVGRIFYSHIDILSYESLGVGRLIYQLPISLCKMFLNEVLEGLTIDNFDSETLITVNKFFENNLNVSETSRQLYIHRNTLVYRLNKLQKLTGLDLTNFDDAIVFKITMMVSEYMRYKEKFSY